MACGPAICSSWQSQLHTQRGWAKRCLLHGCKAVLPSASPGATQLWAWYGRILVLALNAQKHQHSKRPPQHHQKHQHSKRPPQHQGVKRRSHQSLALGAASLPANQTSWSQGVKEFKIWGHGQSLPGNPTPWSQGVKECKLWGHGQQHCQPLKVPMHPIKWLPAPSVLGAHLHLQVPPQVRSAHGNRLWHQSLQTRTSTGHPHPHWALGAMQRRQALLRRTGMQRQHLVR